MGDQEVNLADLTPEEREVYELKVQLDQKRQDVCNTSLFNEAQSSEPISVKIRRRRDLKGHLTKVGIIVTLLCEIHTGPQWMLLNIHCGKSCVVGCSIYPAMWN